METTGAPVPNARKGKQAARRERVAALCARQQRAERRRNLITIGAIAAVAVVIIGGVAWYAASHNSGASAEVIPRSRLALPTTDSDDSAIAAAAMTGDSRIPAIGYKIPAATGMPMPL